MKIYTKTGDLGQTGLVGGSRVSKGSDRIDAIGSVDEANAAFGAVINAPEPVAEILPWIQSRLFDVGAELASPVGSRKTYELISARHTATLEHSIDSLEEPLPSLSQFILPTGAPPAAALHVARGAVRRAERAVVALSKTGNDAVRPDLLAFLNRLSDWAFTAARRVNFDLGVAEVPWTREDTP